MTRLARMVASEKPGGSLGADDGLVTVRPVLDRMPHFAELISTTQDQDFADLRLAEGSGRPLGTAEFVTGLGGKPGDR